MFASRLFKVLLVPSLALSITALTGLLPLVYGNFQSCGIDGGHGLPIPWVSLGCSRCLNSNSDIVCGTNSTSYDWLIFSLDSLLCAGLGYVFLFMRRMRINRLFIGLSATYLGFFITLTMIFINPHSLPLADLLWGSLQTTSLASFADTITLLVEWYMMTLLAYSAILLAEIIGNNLSHRRSSSPNLPALG